LYLFLFGICVFAHIWIIKSLINPVINHHYGVCFSKQIYGISCPACGTTRSVLYILKGELLNAIYMNPLGFIALAFIVIVPMFILVDVLTKRNNLQKLYLFLESKLKEPKYFILVLILIVGNWIWNFIKNN
jgi:hypothetical protein